MRDGRNALIVALLSCNVVLLFFQFGSNDNQLAAQRNSQLDTRTHLQDFLTDTALPQSTSTEQATGERDNGRLLEWLTSQVDRLSVDQMRTDKSDDLTDMLPTPSRWGPSTSRVAVVTASHGSKYEQKAVTTGKTIAEHSVGNKRLYAAVHGYDVHNFDLSYLTQINRSPITMRPRPLVWAKIPVLHGCIQRYDMCLWVDADAIVTNLHLTVESLFPSSDVDLVVGKTWETMALDDPRIPSPAGFRLNTGVIAVRKSEWALDFLRRVWDMESLDKEGKRAYVDGFNHEQSTMQFLLANSQDDARHVFYPPNQLINIHNAFSGMDKWNPDKFILHYYGGFQGCSRKFANNPGVNNNGCIVDFVGHCYQVAQTAPPAVLHRVYSGWDTDPERAMHVGGDVAASPLASVANPGVDGVGQCIPLLWHVLGVNHTVYDHIVKALPLRERVPASITRQMKKHVNGRSWMQEVYVRLHRLLFWMYALPVDFDLGRSHGHAMTNHYIEQVFVPYAKTKMAESPAGHCLAWGTRAPDMLAPLEQLCADTTVLSTSLSECEDGANPTLVCADPQQFPNPTLPPDHFSLVVASFVVHTTPLPLTTLQVLLGTMAEGAHLLVTVPSVTIFHTEPNDLWRFTIEGLNHVLSAAGFCVIRVAPVSNIAVTAAFLQGAAFEDFGTFEHESVDPLAPHSVAALARKPVGGESACPPFEGAEPRRAVDCWRGLYGGANVESARAWGCTPAIERGYSWNGPPWYKINFEHDVRDTTNPSLPAQSLPSHLTCSTPDPLLAALGGSADIERAIATELVAWDRIPGDFAAPLVPLARSGRGWLQALFVRLHRLLYWKYLIPLDLNMGWSRGSPLDRVYLNRKFFPYVLSKNIPGGSCLEWGNTYMAGDFKHLCSHQYEIVEHNDACGGKPGRFNKSSSYNDHRPFHISGDSSQFQGGFCTDIHTSKGIIPDRFFDVVISTFVFEHLHSPWTAAQNIFEMTKPGGHLVWAAPNIEIYHANPGDYYRYTLEGSYQLFTRVGFCVIRIVPCSTVSVTAGFLMGFGDNDFTLDELVATDPVAPHTVALLAQRPPCDRDAGETCQCPPFEGVDFRKDEVDCWRGKFQGEEYDRKCAGGNQQYGWDGVPLHQAREGTFRSAA